MTQLKAVVASLGGSVGKTIVTANVLVPRIPDAFVVAVDTANQTVKDFGINAEIYTSDQFKNLYTDLVRHDSIIIDVGGSKEGKDFLEEMDWMQGHDEVDYFIIPSMPDDKDQKAAVKTIDLLIAQGVNKDKIKVVFNAVKRNTVDEFDYLLGALTAKGIAFSLEASIFENRAYNILSKHNRTVAAMLDDKTDYKARLKASDDVDVEEVTDLLYAQKTAAKLNENLDRVFSALFPKKSAKSAAAPAPATAKG